MIQLRPYQASASLALRSVTKGIVKAPAGSGKTIIGADALLNEFRHNAAMSVKTVGGGYKNIMRILWIANTREQISQAETAFMRVFGVPYLPHEKAPPVEFSCAAGVNGDWDLSKITHLVVDECHHAAADSWRAIIERVPNDCRRWGLSATPDREDDRLQDVYDLLGPVVFEVSRATLEADGHLARAKVKFVTANDRNEMLDAISKAAADDIEASIRKNNWRVDKGYISRAELIDETRRRVTQRWVTKLAIVENIKRNKKIVDVANRFVADGRVVICLCPQVEHARWLSDHVEGSVVIHSKMTIKREGISRKEAIERFTSGDIRCVFATSIADEGLDVPRADALIYACAGRSSGKSEQRTGRVLRSFRDKDRGSIVDFWDRQHPFCLAQSKARARTYERLGYEVVA